MVLKISVIVPVYNVEKYLAQCLDSILNQTLKEIEVICINDGSKDSSKEILEQYMKKDSRIMIINKTNGGYGAACNAGLRMTRGRYVSIIEPDDYIDEKMYEDMYNLAEQNNAQIVKSAFYEYTDPKDGAIESLKKINWSEEYDMPEGRIFQLTECSQLMYFHPSIWSCIYSREFLKEKNIKFVEAKGAGWVDNPFQTETLCLANRIFYTDNAYYYYRLTNPGSSSNIVNMSNPFDRSDEVHEFLEKNQIKDKNILAHLYKREISYIHTVLGGINENLFETAARKIKEMVNRMENNIVYENEYINDYEKSFFEKCKTDTGLECLMKELKDSPENVKVINS